MARTAGRTRPEGSRPAWLAEERRRACGRARPEEPQLREKRDRGGSRILLCVLKQATSKLEGLIRRERRRRETDHFSVLAVTIEERLYLGIGSAHADPEAVGIDPDVDVALRWLALVSHGFESTMTGVSQPLVGAPLSPLLPVRPLAKSKFNYQISRYCRPEKLLVPAEVAEKLEIVSVRVGPSGCGVPIENFDLVPFVRAGELVGYEIVIPEIEAIPGDYLTVVVQNRTRKVALFYVVAVLAILDEKKLLAATLGQAQALSPPDMPLLGEGSVDDSGGNPVGAPAGGDVAQDEATGANDRPVADGDPPADD